MTTVLLILPTGTYRAPAYLAAARALGLDVVTGSERAQALASRMAEHFVLLPLHDPEATADAIVAYAEGTHLDAIVAVDDTGAIGAAAAAERLRLVHSPPAAVRTTRDKIAMRRAFAAAGLPQPAFEVAFDDDEVAAATARIGPPVVVKPPSLAGSRGVIRADDVAGALEAASFVRRILADAGEPAGSPLLVEEFVPGAEVAVEGLLRQGELSVIAVFDKPEPLDGPYFEETIYVAPSSLPPELLGKITAVTAEALRAIGLTDGPIHAELRVPGVRLPTEDALGPAVRLLEVAARTIGGHCSRALELRGGGSLEQLVLATALGVPGPEPVLARAAGVLMVPIPRSGFLAGVSGIDAASKVPHVTGVEITVPRGRFVKALPEGERYLGFVFATAGTAREVETALRRARQLLVVDVAEGQAPAATVT